MLKCLKITKYCPCLGGYIGKRRDLYFTLCLVLCAPWRESKGQNIYSLFVCCSLQVLEMAWNSSCMEALHSSAG